MSGFVGILHSDGAPVDPSLLRRIIDAMSYCGPDGRGVWLDGQVGLGHALLGATPEPANDEHQPCSLDGRTWIAADARVNGRADLIARLRAQGRTVTQDAADAQLILHAYHAWGERCVEQLIGDFAFAIWDGAERRLFCARDHFGVVPFYYARAADGIVLGNVIRSLRLHPAVSDALDKRAIGDFLLFGWNMDHATTTFADIRALPPANALTWQDGVARVRRYWEPPETDREVRFERPEEHVERFGVLFDQAVGDRLRWDRVGTHLSGGMDSTSIAATAHHVLTSRGREFDLRAYTVVFDQLVAEEEGRYADQVAARIGIPVEQVVADEYMTRPPERERGWVFPEPAVVPNQSAEYEIARRVSSFARAQLVGIGGDPLFSASPSWPSGAAQWRDRASFAWLALRSGCLPRFGVRTALRRRIGARRPRVPPLPDWIEPGFARLVDLSTRWRELQMEWDAPEDRRLMLNPFWAALFAWSHPGAHGLPIRTLFPFFDLRLVEHVWRTPAYPWRQDKRLLREAMRGRLPDVVLRRPKTPLYVPTGRVHTDNPRYRVAVLPETRRWRARLLSGAAIGEYVDVERARALVETPVPRWTVPFIENCFTLAHWLESDLHVRGHVINEEEIRHVGDPATA